MDTGDKIVYTYLHSLNSKSKVQRSKNGIFLRWIKSKGLDGQHPAPKKTAFAIVKLDGNKNNSKIHASQFKEQKK